MVGMPDTTTYSDMLQLHLKTHDYPQMLALIDWLQSTGAETNSLLYQLALTGARDPA